MVFQNGEEKPWYCPSAVLKRNFSKFLQSSCVVMKNLRCLAKSWESPNGRIYGEFWGIQPGRISRLESNKKNTSPTWGPMKWLLNGYTFQKQATSTWGPTKWIEMGQLPGDSRWFQSRLSHFELSLFCRFRVLLFSWDSLPNWPYHVWFLCSLCTMCMDEMYYHTCKMYVCNWMNAMYVMYAKRRSVILRDAM